MSSSFYAFVILCFFVAIRSGDGASTDVKGKYSKDEKLSDEAMLQYEVDEDKSMVSFALTITDKNIIKDGEPTFVGLGIGHTKAVPSHGMYGSDIVTAEFEKGEENDDKCDVKDRYTALGSGTVVRNEMEGSGEGHEHGEEHGHKDGSGKDGEEEEEGGHSHGGRGGRLPDVDTCGERDWTLVRCARDVEKGIMVLEVERGFKGRDNQDREIVSGMQQVLYAYGNEFKNHGHERRNSSYVNFFGTEDGKDVEGDDFGKNDPASCRSETSPNTTANTNESGSDTSDGECFPYFATVELESGSTISMDKLAVGDRVKTLDGKHSEVYFFTHRDPKVSSYFVELEAGSQNGKKYIVSASRGHWIVTSRGLVAANRVRLGDILYNEEGDSLSVISTRLIQSHGLYSPHTMEGTILVNGIRASTYSNYLPSKIAHALLLPERMAYRLGFSLYGGQRYVQGTCKSSGRPYVVQAAYRLIQAIKLPLRA